MNLDGLLESKLPETVMEILRECLDLVNEVWLDFLADTSIVEVNDMSDLK